MDLIASRRWAAALAFPAQCVDVQTWRREEEEEAEEREGEDESAGRYD
jgi:hypothetical protein